MFGSPLYTWGLISSTVYGGENFSARNHKKVEGGKIETLYDRHARATVARSFPHTFGFFPQLEVKKIS